MDNLFFLSMVSRVFCEEIVIINDEDEDKFI